jgi:hypothetical protein
VRGAFARLPCGWFYLAHWLSHASGWRGEAQSGSWTMRLCSATWHYQASTRVYSARQRSRERTARGLGLPLSCIAIARLERIIGRDCDVRRNHGDCASSAVFALFLGLTLLAALDATWPGMGASCAYHDVTGSQAFNTKRSSRPTHSLFGAWPASSQNAPPSFSWVRSARPSSIYILITWCAGCSTHRLTPCLGHSHGGLLTERRRIPACHASASSHDILR